MLAKSESDTEDNQEEEQQQQSVKEEIKPSQNSTNARSGMIKDMTFNYQSADIKLMH